METEINKFIDKARDYSMTDRWLQSSNPKQLLSRYSTYFPPKINQADPDEYSSLVTLIADCLSYGSYSKHTRIRVKAWLDKL
jgi:hypothetical protein